MKSQSDLKDKKLNVVFSACLLKPKKVYKTYKLLVVKLQIKDISKPSLSLITAKRTTINIVKAKTIAVPVETLHNIDSLIMLHRLLCFSQHKQQHQQLKHQVHHKEQQKEIFFYNNHQTKATYNKYKTKFTVKYNFQNKSGTYHKCQRTIHSNIRRNSIRAKINTTASTTNIISRKNYIHNKKNRISINNIKIKKNYLTSTKCRQDHFGFSVSTNICNLNITTKQSNNKYYIKTVDYLSATKERKSKNSLSSNTLKTTALLSFFSLSFPSLSSSPSLLSLLSFLISYYKHTWCSTSLFISTLFSLSESFSKSTFGFVVCV